MLKLNASYSKKVPAEGDYSSQSYHVAIELELPSNLTTNEMNDQIAETFKLCRESVESELNSKRTPSRQNEHQYHTRESTHNEPEEPTASSKQVSYLNVLAKRQKIDILTLMKKFGVNNIYHLSRKQCASLIEELQAA